MNEPTTRERVSQLRQIILTFGERLIWARTVEIVHFKSLDSD